MQHAGTPGGLWCTIDRCRRRRRHTRDISGGEGDRTPDLVNAIHALSQLSYAPAPPSPPKSVRRNHIQVFPQEPRNLPEGIYEVKQIGLAQKFEADILQ